jgi:hypothetical protein
LASKYGWDQRGEAFMKLRGLVERRYWFHLRSNENQGS